MATIQFSHANGIPAPVYQPLLDQLVPHDIHYLPVLGETVPPIRRNWAPLVDELISTLDARNEGPVVGMGHSLGGVVTLMAGKKRPDLFEKIILLDPPLLPWRIRRIVLPMAWMGPRLFRHIFPLAKGALKRRDHFHSKEEAYEYWSPKSFFRAFDPPCFEAYVEHALIPDKQGGFTLRIPKKMEAQIFATTPLFLPKAHPEIPTHYLYAIGKGAILEDNEVQEHQVTYPHFSFHPIPYGHMFPVEQPKWTAELIHSLI